MAIMTLPEAPAPQPPPRPQSNADATRFVAIRANLLPDEIVDARRARHMMRMVAVGLVALIALLIGGYAVTAWQTSGAKKDLAAAQRGSVTLRNQERAFGPLVAAQAQAASIKAELTKLMAGDLPWKDLLATLRKSATGGVTITSVSGDTTAGAASATSNGAGGLGILNQSGKEQVGTLTISGSAPDKNAVATYIDTLTKVTGLAAPFPASLTGQAGKLTFSASVIITSDALGGRYARSANGGH
jgi:Tfp pilus assembly protein PilN